MRIHANQRWVNRTLTQVERYRSATRLRGVARRGSLFVLTPWCVFVVVLTSCTPGSVDSPAIKGSRDLPLPATLPVAPRLEASLEVPGWATAEIPFPTMEGSAYAIGNQVLFWWGGAVDRGGELESAGLLIDIETGNFTPTPPAPIRGRFLPAMVWSGDEFLIFGGHTFDESLVDGAAFNPSTMRWRILPSAPLEAVPFGSAVWSGLGMVVWQPEGDSPRGSFPESSTGRLATYQPRTNRWTPLPEPPIDAIDVALFTSANGILLVGGPTMRDLGSIGMETSVVATTLSGSGWGPVHEGPVIEAGRPFQMPDGSPAFLASDMSVFRLDGQRWLETTRIESECWWDTGAASGGGEVYLKSCSNFRMVGSKFVEVLPAGMPGTTGNLFGAAFLATDDRKLVTLGRSVDVDGVHNAVLGVFDPNGPGG